jgi:Gly-Xaa carboxypeptidase
LPNVSIVSPVQIAVLTKAGEAITHLLENGWEPRRTVILSHGFDEEEVSARRGQGQIAPLLEERYGKDGIFMLVDEGSGTTEDVSYIVTGR